MYYSLNNNAGLSITAWLFYKLKKSRSFVTISYNKIMFDIFQI